MNTQEQDVVDGTVAHTSAGGELAPRDSQTVTPAAPISQTDVAWRMIEKAMSSDVDLDRLEKLMDMHTTLVEREEAKEAKRAEQAFNEARAASRSEVERIIPNQSNTHTKSKYADLDAINAQLVPALARHGLHVSAKPTKATVEGWIAINLIIHGHGHKDQTYIQGPADDGGMKGNSNKTGIQAIGSSYTYLMRYAIRLAFNLAVAKDTDGNAPQPETQKVPAEKLKELNDLLNKTGTRPEAVLGRFNINKLEDLQPAAFTEVMNMLKQRVN